MILKHLLSAVSRFSLRPATFSFLLLAPAWGGLQVDDLRCEYLENPIGLHETAPRFSWIVTSGERAQVQGAWRVLVASSPEKLSADNGDLWDSGRMEGDDTCQVVYAGEALSSRDGCYWKVMVWDGEGEASTWSKPASFHIGLLDASDWTAKWIDGHAIAGKEIDEKELAKSIEIREVHYEAIDGAGAKEVTEIFRERANDGPFEIEIENDPLGGDPIYGHRKQLRVEYREAGEEKTKLLAENTRFRFPQSLVEETSVPYLRKSFELSKPVASAMVYATALGIYELRMNGKRVGDHILAPEWTEYNSRLSYQAYDVTDLVKEGKNALGAQVAHGWYSGHIGNGGYQYWGKSPALLAQLEVNYEDGSSERVVSDGSWRAGPSAMQSTDFMYGENYDAREEVTGWDTATLDDSGWGMAVEREVEPRPLTGQVMEPSRVLMELPAKEMAEVEPGKYAFDLGQNLVGVIRLKTDEPAGTKITIRHAEMLNPDGTLYTTNLRGAPSIDTYICKGGGEVWQPKFTFHGFRYVELSGLTKKPSLEAVTGIVIGSDTAHDGEFTCSDPDINQLQSNIVWGQRGNYLSVPTDCPQRDERLGWMGDAQVFVKTATYNADVAAFFNKWLLDVTDSQRENGIYTDVSPFAGPSMGTPAWGDAGVICPWTIYQAYGDTRVLEQSYPHMVKWIEWCGSQSEGSIRTGNRGSDYGDWLSINANTDKEMIGTAYYAYSTSLLARTAEVLGKSEDAKTYRDLFETIREAFINKYVSDDARITSDTQCAYAMALKFGLLPEELRAKAADRLAADIEAKDTHLSTGFIGVGYLLPVLTDAGKTDLAYRLIHQDTFPSWLFSVKHGATTIWERWDGWTPDKGFQDPGMNSFNHYSLGSCGEWFYETVAGIRQPDGGDSFKEIIIDPRPGGNLTSATARVGTIRGEVISSWKMEGGRFMLDVRLPANTTATVHVPAPRAQVVKESGKTLDQAAGVRFVKMENGAAVLELGSGDYRFTVN